MKIIEWSAFEYEEKDRSNDWFWALGVIVVAGSITSVIIGNYFFAIFIVLAGFLMWMFAVKKPEMVNYEFGEKGLKMNTRLLSYENMKAFFIQLPGEENPSLHPTLFIKSERMFMPIYSIPIEIQNAKDTKNILLLKSIPEEKMEEHASHKVMESLGF